MWFYVPSVCAPASEDSSLDSDPWYGREPSVTLSGIPTQRPFSWRGWMTRPWIGLLSGLTCRASILARGVEKWISSLQASHASLSRLPADAVASTITGGSGTTLPGSSTRSGLKPCSSRTCPVCSLPEGERAYVAGLIDGEGCIGIACSRGKYYSARVDVGMSEVALPLLNQLQATFGGSVSQSRKQTEKWAAAFRWTLEGRLAAAFCLCIAPYLRLKRKQAEIVSMPGLDGKTKEQIHKLNRKGPSRMPSGWFARLVGAKWKTHPTLFEPSPEFSGTWPQAGMMLRGIVSRLSKSGRRTSANVCSYSRGLYPTPSATPYGTSQNEGEVEHDRPSRGTPSPESWARGRPWPTPTVRGNWNKESYSSKAGAGLQQVAQEASHPGPTKSKDGMVLNVPFVERLMGFPEGWTDCDASVTPSSQNRRL